MLSIFDYQLLYHSLVLGVLLFTVGLVGFVSRRNLVVMMISAGVMFQGVMLTLTSFGTFHGDWSGQVFSILVLVTIVVQGVVALSVIYSLVRSDCSLDVSSWRALGSSKIDDEVGLADAESSTPVNDLDPTDQPAAASLGFSPTERLGGVND